MSTTSSPRTASVLSPLSTAAASDRAVSWGEVAHCVQQEVA
ncbi:hypothetical protein ACFXPX_34000 [Kitasatospora sp. NPDC059146]